MSKVIVQQLHHEKGHYLDAHPVQKAEIGAVEALSLEELLQPFRHFPEDVNAILFGDPLDGGSAEVPLNGAQRLLLENTGHVFLADLERMRLPIFDGPQIFRGYLFGVEQEIHVDAANFHFDQRYLRLLDLEQVGDLVLLLQE